MSSPAAKEIDLLHEHICLALADPKRLQILYALHEHSCNVTDLVNQLQMPQPTISRHLTILRQRSLVNTTRDGNRIIYELADPRVIHILDAMRDVLRSCLERQIDSVS